MRAPVSLAVLFLGLIAASAARPAPERGPFAKATLIGSPNLERWPVSDPANALARSVRDMHLFRGRIYIGGGDLVANKGPVTIWSLGRDGFDREYTAPDEQVSLFREAEGMLVVPSADPRESWAFGNLYVKDPRKRSNSGWKELRTIPKALHVLDFISCRGSWFVWHTTDGAGAPVLRSKDGGKTWERVLENGGPFLPIGDCFLILRGAEVLRCDGESAAPCSVALFPDSTTSGVTRCAAFGTRVLYSPVDLLGLSPAPLFLLDASEAKDGGSARLVEAFARERVRDVVVRDGACHVLTAERIDADSETCRGVIRSSADLAEWTVTADFTVPGLPWSFELLAGRYHVGLGARRSTASAGAPPVGPESGAIYRID